MFTGIIDSRPNWLILKLTCLCLRFSNDTREITHHGISDKEENTSQSFKLR